jgi:glutamyl-tRNA reductase
VNEIALAEVDGMSASAVSRALEDRFEAIRRAEVQRLRRKLSGLSDSERSLAEAIIAEVVRALTVVPVQALAENSHRKALEAVVRLFGLDTKSCS